MQYTIDESDLIADLDNLGGVMDVQSIIWYFTVVSFFGPGYRCTLRAFSHICLFVSLVEVNLKTTVGRSRINFLSL